MLDYVDEIMDNRTEDNLTPYRQLCKEQPCCAVLSFSKDQSISVVIIGPLCKSHMPKREQKVRELPCYY